MWGKKVYETWSWSKFIAFTLWISFNDYSSGLTQFFFIAKGSNHFNKKFLYFVLIGTFSPCSAMHKSQVCFFFFSPSLEHIHRRHFYRYQLMVLNEYYSFSEHWTCTTYAASTFRTPYSDAQCHTIPLKMNNVPFSSYMIPNWTHCCSHIVVIFMADTFHFR